MEDLDRMVKEWIKNFERIFERTRILSKNKVICATYMLQKDTCHWWDTRKEIVEHEQMTWKRLKEIFYQKHFSIIY